MKYVCTVCGYIYDDAEHDIPFADLPDSWVCPLCGAPKALFEKVEDKVEKTYGNPAEPEEKAETVQNEKTAETDEDMVELSAGELSSLFSNLARGCEKQYQSEAESCFRELADYFEDLTPQESNLDIEYLSELVKHDIDVNYADLKAKAQAENDRGTLRVTTWGEKVSRMAKSLIDRYLNDRDGFLENTNLYICTVCGFLYVGDNPPEICPVCKVPSWKFEKIDGRIKK